jgi:hypothetical protein
MVDHAQLSPPGRVCPLRYRYGPHAIAHAAERTAETLYVIGGLYNGVDKPSLGSGLLDHGKVKRRGLISRKGHKLIFLDGDDASGIALISSDGKIRIALKESAGELHVVSDGTNVIE